MAATEQRDEYISLTALFGENSMEAWATNASGCEQPTDAAAIWRNVNEEKPRSHEVIRRP
jgi:hypothetical protein